MPPLQLLTGVHGGVGAAGVCTGVLQLSALDAPDGAVVGVVSLSGALVAGGSVGAAVSSLLVSRTDVLFVGSARLPARADDDVLARLLAPLLASGLVAPVSTSAPPTGPTGLLVVPLVSPVVVSPEALLPVSVLVVVAGIAVRPEPAVVVVPTVAALPVVAAAVPPPSVANRRPPIRCESAGGVQRWSVTSVCVCGKQQA